MKELVFKAVETVLMLIGMILTTVVLYRDNAALTGCTLVVAAAAGAVYYIYRRHEIAGIVSGIIATVAYFGLFIYQNPETDWDVSIIFGLLFPFAGAITIGLGGMIGLFGAEVIKFLLRLIWPAKKTIA